MSSGSSRQAPRAPTDMAACPCHRRSPLLKTWRSEHAADPRHPCPRVSGCSPSRFPRDASVALAAASGRGGRKKIGRGPSAPPGRGERWLRSASWWWRTTRSSARCSAEMLEGMGHDVCALGRGTGGGRCGRCRAMEARPDDCGCAAPGEGSVGLRCGQKSTVPDRFRARVRRSADISRLQALRPRCRRQICPETPSRGRPCSGPSDPRARCPGCVLRAPLNNPSWCDMDVKQQRS